MGLPPSFKPKRAKGPNFGRTRLVRVVCISSLRPFFEVRIELAFRLELPRDPSLVSAQAVRSKRLAELQDLLDHRRD
jgi:hypothetical protein